MARYQRFKTSVVAESPLYAWFYKKGKLRQFPKTSWRDQPGTSWDLFTIFFWNVRTMLNLGNFDIFFTLVFTSKLIIFSQIVFLGSFYVYNICKYNLEVLPSHFKWIDLKNIQKIQFFINFCENRNKILTFSPKFCTRI